MKKRWEALIRLLANASPVLLLVLTSLFLLTYLATALSRISFPFELDWIEGGHVAQVQRILDGQPVYDKPSLDYTAAIYTPLYYYVSALFGMAVGNGFFTLRLLSFVSSLGCFAFIFLIVHRRTSSSLASFVASFLYAATFSISGFFFDLAHPDSLFLLFLLVGIYAYESKNIAVRTFVSPMFLFLSFFTKQQAVIVAIGLSLGALLSGKGFKRMAFALIFGVLVIGSFCAMGGFANEWYKYYIFDLPSQHGIYRRGLTLFWIEDLPKLGIALCFCYVAFAWRRVEERTSERISQDVLLFGSLFLASFLSRIHYGSWINILMPLHAGIAIYFGIGLDLCLKRFGRVASLKLLVVLATLFQFLSLTFDPQEQIPNPAVKQAGEKLLQRISTIPGEVYWWDHPWYLHMLGKPMQAQEMAIDDVIRARKQGRWKQVLEQEMAAAVASGRYEAFVSDFKEFNLRPPDFDIYYELVDSNLTGNAFPPRTGWNRKPTFLYMRRPAQQSDSADADKSRR
jgi:hypothetical protein